MNENQRQNTKEFISKEYPDYSRLWDTINVLMETQPKETIRYFSDKDTKLIDDLMENKTCQNHIRLMELFIDRLSLDENQFPEWKNETRTIYNKVYKDKLQETDKVCPSCGYEWDTEMDTCYHCGHVLKDKKKSKKINDSVIQYKNEMLENIKRGWNQ